MDDFEAYVSVAWPRLLRSAWLRAALAQILASLPGQQRAVLMLRYHADLTEAATAQALGISVGTVKSYTARALTALRADPAVRAIVTEEATP